MALDRPVHATETADGTTASAVAVPLAYSLAYVTLLAPVGLLAALAYPVSVRDDSDLSPLATPTTPIVDVGFVLGWDAPTRKADLATGRATLRGSLGKGEDTFRSLLADAEFITTDCIQSTSQREGVRCTYQTNPLGSNGKRGRFNLSYGDPTQTVFSSSEAVHANIGDVERDEVETALTVQGSVRSVPWLVPAHQWEPHTSEGQPTPLIPASPRPAFWTTATFVHRTILRSCRPSGHPLESRYESGPHIHTSAGQRP